LLYEKRILCLIDIRGFKRKILESISDEKENIKRTNEIMNLLKYLRKEFDVDHNYYMKTFNCSKDNAKKLKNTERTTQFSDLTVISYEISKESALYHIITKLIFLTAESFKKDLFIRGAITIGSLYHDEKYIFGPVMNKAYEMEKKKAKFPRVIIENNAIYDLLEKDDNEYYYIDYFNVDPNFFDDLEYDLVPYTLDIRRVIENNLKNEDKKINEKNGCMIKNFNNMLEIRKAEFKEHDEIYDFFDSERAIVR